MCQCIYLGASRDLGERAFEPAAPGFYFTRLSAEEPVFAQVAELLQLPYLYFIGGSEGCSCSLSYNDEWADTPEQMAYSRASKAEVTDMLGFLRAQLPSTEMRLLCTWWETPVEEIKPAQWSDWNVPESAFQLPLDSVLTLKA